MARTQGKNSTLMGNIVEFFVLLVVVFIIRTYGFGLYQVPTGSMETTMLVGERFFADKFSYILRKPARGEIIAFNDPTYTFSKNSIMSLFEQYVWGPSNWTKRIIGVPGDTVRGTVENGKPVVYLNGEKLDELYLNKYPLIHVWKQDPQELRKQIEQELDAAFRGRSYDESMFNTVLFRKLAGQEKWFSYDSSKPYDQQPFYRIYSERVILGEDGKPELLWPGTPISMPVDDNIAANTRHWDRSDQFYVELAEDEYWCMGDNRLASKDCRVLGPIKANLIHGRILFRIWSIDSDESWWIFDLLRHPIDFWTRIRWSRFVQWIA